jgi:carbonic anhydrase/acetyltransferase-like protein (isoleucine patch superfamily)
MAGPGDAPAIVSSVRPVTLLRRHAERLAGDLALWGWGRLTSVADLGPRHRRARGFARFGEGSLIAFPSSVLHGVDRIEIGGDTTIGPNATLSTGMLVPLHEGSDPILTIGDRCQLGKGLTVVAHERVEIGDDTCAGHYVFVTDQNHGYEDVDIPIRWQMWKNAPVRIGRGCWLGHGAMILPGTVLGDHVAVAAGAVVSGTFPDRSVVAGVPARVVRRHVAGHGWVATDPDGTPRPE